MPKIINMRLLTMIQQRPEKWAVRLPAFGFTVYGNTPEEARTKSREAVSTLIQSFADRQEVEAFLQNRNIDYEIKESGFRDDVDLNT